MPHPLLISSQSGVLIEIHIFNDKQCKIQISWLLQKPTDLDLHQGSGNFEIWIGPADDDDVINEPISKKKKYVYITCHEN